MGDQPARTGRNAEQHHQKEDGWERRDAELPAPFGCAKSHPRDAIVGKISQQYADDDIDLKKAEDEEALVLRFYEWAGKESDIKLLLPAGASSVAETDLMERPVADVALQEGTVTVHTRPFEIKTLRIRFAPKVLATPAARSSN